MFKITRKVLFEKKVTFSNYKRVSHVPYFLWEYAYKYIINNKQAPVQKLTKIYFELILEPIIKKEPNTILCQYEDTRLFITVLLNGRMFYGIIHYNDLEYIIENGPCGLREFTTRKYHQIFDYTR